MFKASTLSVKENYWMVLSNGQAIYVKPSYLLISNIEEETKGMDRTLPRILL